MLAPPKVDWRDLLLHAIEDAVSYQQGMVEYTYTRPSRRQAASEDVLPGTWEPVPEVGVVLDTSGSMFTAATSPTSSAEAEEGAAYGTLLQEALNEIGGILEDYGQDIGVQIFATDTAVGWADRVFDLADIELVGGGGTDMGVGLEAAYEADEPMNVLICLTDGYTPWPEEGPEGNVSVVVGIVGTTEAELQQHWPPPAWADDVIFIDEE
jgi:predicted metal-dependent peptidase